MEQLQPALLYLLENQDDISSHELKSLPKIMGIQDESMNKQGIAHLKKLYYYVTPAELMEELLQNSTASLNQFT
jgi:hypothetical protein